MDNYDHNLARVIIFLDWFTTDCENQKWTRSHQITIGWRSKIELKRMGRGRELGWVKKMKNEIDVARNYIFDYLPFCFFSETLPVIKKLDRLINLNHSLLTVILEEAVWRKGMRERKDGSEWKKWSFFSKLSLSSYFLPLSLMLSLNS